MRYKVFLYLHFFDTDIDDCVSIACQNNGTCVDGIDDYNCTCVIGFTGQHCETSKNDCIPKLV